MDRRKGTCRMDTIDIVMLHNLEDILEIAISEKEDELTELRLQLSATRKVRVRREQEIIVERVVEEITPKQKPIKRTWDNPGGL